MKISECSGGIKISLDGLKILIDPIEKFERIDSILISHAHSDHSRILSYELRAKAYLTPETLAIAKIRMKNIQSVNMQFIENPALESDYYDKGLTNSADAIIILINSLDDIQEIKPLLNKATKQQIIIYNTKQNLNINELRKLNAKMKSKKFNFIITNLINPSQELIKTLENKIFQTFGKIRIFTKEPNKEKSPKPIILKQNSTVKNIAEKILKGFSKNS